MRKARRAHFGSILQMLEETGIRDETIVIVCDNHGDKLGDRGLWYKMHYFKGAARVPMIAHAPTPEMPLDGCSLMPYLVGGLIDRFGFTPTAMGAWNMAETLCYAVALPVARQLGRGTLPRPQAVAKPPV